VTLPPMPILFVFPCMYLEATGTLACWKLSMSRAEAMFHPPTRRHSDTASHLCLNRESWTQ
jgi:hypothetical protein